MVLRKGRAFIDRGLAADGSRTLVALDGGPGIFIANTPPPTTAMYVGSSVQNSAANLTSLEGQLGQQLGIVRLYDTGPNLPNGWSNPAAIGGNRPVVISFKFDTVAMGNGSLDATFNHILDTAPTGRRIYWVCGQHEGDVKINGNVFTLPQWQASAVRMANMVKARSVAAWKTAVITTMQPFNGGKSYGPEDFWMPGLTDTFGVDKFNPNNNPATNSNYRPLSYWIGDAVAWYAAHSVPWFIGETNAYEDFTDLTKKASWITNGLQYASANKCLAFCYWSTAFGSDPDQTARPLDSSTKALQAFAAGIQLYNP